MNKTKQNELFNSISNGYFDKAESVLSSCLIDSDVAMKILIYTCNTCVNPKVKQQISFQSLKNVVLHISKFVTDVTGPDIILNYLKSIFHILKLLVLEDQINYVLELEDVWLPQFMKNGQGEDVNALYKSICHVLYNKIVQFSKSTCPEELGDLVLLFLKMFAPITALDTLLQRYAANLFGIDYFATVKLEQQMFLYMEFLDLLQIDDVSSYYCYMVDVIRTMFQNMCKKDIANRKFISNFLNEILRIARNFSSSKLQQLLHESINLSQFFALKLEDASGADRFERSLEKLQKIMEECTNYSCNNEIHSTYHLIYVIFCYTFQYLRSASTKLTNYLNCKTLLLISKVFKLMETVCLKIEKKCRFCSSCNLKTDLTLSVYIHSLFIEMFKEYVGNGDEIDQEVHDINCKIIERSCVQIFSIKSKDCKTWKSLWTEVGRHVYNTAVKLFKIKATHTIYYKLFVKHANLLEGYQGTTIKKDLVYSSMECLIELYLKKGQHEDALLFAALNLLYFPANVKTTFSQWVQIKADMKKIEKKKDLVRLSTVCVLEKGKEKIAKLFQNFQLDRETEVNLLKVEIEQYKSIWPSPIPMISAYKKLCKSADLCLLIRMSVEIWNDYTITVNEEFVNLIEATLSDFNSKYEQIELEPMEKMIYWAHLNVISYKVRLSFVQQKNAEEMSKCITPLTPALPHEEAKNVNDECDLVSVYSNLRLEKFIKLLELLDKSVNLLSELMKFSKTDRLKELLRKNNTIGTMKYIGKEYSLHCFSAKALEAWTISLNLSEILEEDLQKLDCIGNIVKLCYPHSEKAKELVLQGENLLKQHEEEQPEIVLNFLINKSLLFLRQERIEDGYKEFERATTLFASKENFKQRKLIEAQLSFVHVQFLMLPCKFNIDSHNVRCLYVLHETLNGFVELYRKNSRSTQDLLGLFEASEYVSWTYRWLHLPRELRCYTRQLVKIAQEFVIPLRTCTYLTYLAFGDIESLRLEDCEVKVDGLSDILCLRKFHDNPMASNEIVPEVKCKEVEEIDGLAEYFDGIVLDKPSTYQASSGSPLLIVKQFKMPSFAKHEIDCKCYCCTSIEYQSLVLINLTLKAELNVWRENKSAAQDFFNGAFRFYSLLYAKRKRFMEKLGNDLCHRWEESLSEPYILLLYYFGNYLLTSKDYKKFASINKKAQEILAKILFKNVYLYNEVVFQQFLMETISPREETRERYLALTPDANENKESLLKTPENTQTRIEFRKTFRSPAPSSRVVKAIKFELPDEDEENKIVKCNKSPVNNAPKTPAPLLRVPPLAVSTITTRKKKHDTDFLNANREFEDVLKASPNAYTPSCMKMQNSALRTRSKVLTEKLKQSAANEKKNGQERLRKTRKNLLMELPPDNDKETDTKSQNTKKTVIGEVKRRGRPVKK